MANEIKELKMMIVASINILPAEDIDDLMSRDFLRNRAKYGVETLVADLIQNKHLYYKNRKLYAKKSSSFLKQN